VPGTASIHHLQVYCPVFSESGGFEACFQAPCKPALVVPAAWRLANVLDWESGLAATHPKVEIWKSQVAHNTEKMRFRRAGDTSDNPPFWIRLPFGEYLCKNQIQTDSLTSRR